LSGIAVCNTIFISTKRKGENKKYLIKIDAKKIREEIENKTKKLTLVLTENVTIGETSAPIDEHGTHVRLHEILDESKVYLLSIENMLDYMSLTLPVDFDPKFIFYKRITQELKKNVPHYKPVNIFLGDQPIYRPPFIKDLDPPQIIPLTKGKELLGFSWFCMHKDKKAVEEPSSRGIIYKKYGFTVGDRNICLNWWQKAQHLINWCVGEIHIIHPSILPNSERIDFENSHEKDELISQLQKKLQVAIDEASRQKSFFINLEDRIKKVNTLPQKPVSTIPETLAEEITNITILKRLLEQDKRKSYYTDFADDRLQKRTENAIKRAKMLIGIYQKVPGALEVKPPKEILPEIPLTKVEIIPKPTYLSLSDLLKDVNLESQIIIQAVEDVLDEYFKKDPQICSEIKQKISSKIKELLS
jgi:hypothetical protein